jgi:hypothetical protein
MPYLSRIWLVAVLLPPLWAGCGLHHRHGLHGPADPQAAALQNPLFVPGSDREFLWNQVVDSVDNYFEIKREVRVHQVADVPLEGFLETFPRDGSTILEPWRKDSTHGYEKLHATLQSIRRTAVVRVQPVQGGHVIDVVVQKELEDLDRPEYASSGRFPLRSQQTLQADGADVSPIATAAGWIPIGRDTALEQRILAQIRGRVSEG